MQIQLINRNMVIGEDGMCKTQKWIVHQSGDKLKQPDCLMDILLDFSASIVIQLIPIWIMTLIMFSIQDVPMRVGTFIENMLVYNIVVCSGNVVTTKNNNKYRGKFLAVIIIIAASIAFFGEYMSSSGIGGVGFKIQTFRYIFITTSVFKFTSLVQYFEVVEKYKEEN